MAKKMNIECIGRKEALKVIDTRKPLGLFVLHDLCNDCYSAIDNSTGDAWVEDFDTMAEAIAWLKQEKPPMA